MCLHLIISHSETEPREIWRQNRLWARQRLLDPCLSVWLLECALVLVWRRATEWTLGQSSTQWPPQSKLGSTFTAHSP